MVIAPVISIVKLDNKENKKSNTLCPVYKGEDGHMYQLLFYKNDRIYACVVDQMVSESSLNDNMLEMVLPESSLTRPSPKLLTEDDLRLWDTTYVSMKELQKASLNSKPLGEELTQYYSKRRKTTNPAFDRSLEEKAWQCSATFACDKQEIPFRKYTTVVM